MKRYLRYVGSVVCINAAIMFLYQCFKFDNQKDIWFIIFYNLSILLLSGGLMSLVSTIKEQLKSDK